jgi:N-acyl-D-amino-acid deacylase
VTSVIGVGPTFDLVIEGGVVIDGLGGLPRATQVGVRDGVIAALGDLTPATAGHRIHARGSVVAPGFVDIHSHSDFTLLADPSGASGLAQGVTTEIVGNCGHGCAPIEIEAIPRMTSNIYGWAPGIRAIDWTTVGGYLDALEAARPAINIATLVPYGNLRLLALDDVGRAAAPMDVRRLKWLLDKALDEGAVGLSTGLEYPAEHLASAREIHAMCRRVAARNRLYATHTRDRGLGVVRGTREGLATARATGVRTQVSHILARHGSGGSDANEKIAQLLEEAAADLRVGWDVHTRLFGITNLSTALVPAVLRSAPDQVAAALDGDVDALMIGAGDNTVIAAFGRAGWDRSYVLDAGPRWAELERTSVASVAMNAGVAPEDILLAVLRDAALAGDIHRPMAFAITYDEADIAKASASSRCMVGSDATTMGLESPLRSRMLPGAFTWAAWFLRRVVRELGALPLEEAVRRLTALPADQAGLVDRGRIAVGARADLVVFDPSAISEPADGIRPLTLAVGVDHVLVNGVAAWSNGRITGERAGMVLRA